MKKILMSLTVCYMILGLLVFTGCSSNENDYGKDEQVYKWKVTVYNCDGSILKEYKTKHRPHGLDAGVRIKVDGEYIILKNLNMIYEQL